MIVPEVAGNLIKPSLAYVCGLLNSFAFDFLIRPFVDKHIKGYVLKRLPIPSYTPENNVIERISELSLETAALSTELMRGLTESSNQYRQLRAKLDALVAHYLKLNLYELNVVLESFTSLREQEKLSYGEFISANLIREEFSKLTTLVNA